MPSYRYDRLSALLGQRDSMPTVERFIAGADSPAMG